LSERASGGEDADEDEGRERASMQVRMRVR
jgi:hypothetical protein